MAIRRVRDGTGYRSGLLVLRLPEHLHVHRMIECMNSSARGRLEPTQSETGAVHDPAVVRAEDAKLPGAEDLREEVDRAARAVIRYGATLVYPSGLCVAFMVWMDEVSGFRDGDPRERRRGAQGRGGADAPCPSTHARPEPARWSTWSTRPPVNPRLRASASIRSASAASPRAVAITDRL